VPARVLVIGLDSAEATLVERWTAEGKLPSLARLYEQGAAYRLDNCWCTLPTSVWPELTSGRSPGELALYFPPAQLRTGEAEPRRVLSEDVDPTGFWTIASDAGRRVAAIDLPWTVAPRRLDGIFLSEWGTHDRWFGTESFPATLVAELRARHGEYPVGLCDRDYGASVDERLRLVGDLLRAVEHETALLLDLLGSEEWDLFACAFGQLQCVGHNFWAFADAPDAPGPLRTALLDVYARVDEGLAALRRAAGPDAVTAVVASHGMGPLVGGPQLLQEVLVRLGFGSGHGHLAEVRSRLPFGVRRTIRRLVPGPARRRLQRAAGSLPAPLASPSTRAVALPADVNGYIRLNLRGREPHGCVEPGPEAEATLEEIRIALCELTHPGSGEPIVAGVVTADEAFGRDRHPDVPDLMVSFRNDLGPLDACVSERVGVVRVPARVANRSGDHTGEARLWLAGGGIAPRSRHARAHAADVAPTVLALLGVPAPEGLAGRALVESGD
jgi:predicted AlkP superfamily phosphohydrolase/phosphomutase